MVPPFGPFVPRFLREKQLLIFLDFLGTPSSSERMVQPYLIAISIPFRIHHGTHPGTAASLFLPLGIIRMIQDDDILIDID